MPQIAIQPSNPKSFNMSKPNINHFNKPNFEYFKNNLSGGKSGQRAPKLRKHFSAFATSSTQRRKILLILSHKFKLCVSIIAFFTERQSRQFFLRITLVLSLKNIGGRPFEKVPYLRPG